MSNGFGLQYPMNRVCTEMSFPTSNRDLFHIWLIGVNGLNSICNDCITSEIR